MYRTYKLVISAKAVEVWGDVGELFFVFEHEGGEDPSLATAVSLALNWIRERLKQRIIGFMDLRLSPTGKFGFSTEKREFLVITESIAEVAKPANSDSGKRYHDPGYGCRTGGLASDAVSTLMCDMAPGLD